MGQVVGGAPRGQVVGGVPPNFYNLITNDQDGGVLVVGSWFRVSGKRMWRNEKVVWCISCRELVPHKRQTHTKSMFSIVLGIANRLSFSDQLPYAGSRAGGRAGGRAGSELD